MTTLPYYKRAKIGDLVEFVKITSAKAPLYSGIFEVVYIVAKVNPYGEDSISIVVKRLDDDHTVLVNDDDIKCLDIAGTARLGQIFLCVKWEKVLTDSQWFIGMLLRTEDGRHPILRCEDGTEKTIQLPEWKMKPLIETGE